jgi:hypothetical protein
MNRFDYELERAKSALLKKELSKAGRSTTPSYVRLPSVTEQNSVFTPVNYGLLFCVHGKSYFDLCPTCKRDRKRATLEYQAFLRRHSLTD